MTSAIRRIGKVAKPKPATKAELRREIAELRKVGRQMSNICFNLGQSSVLPLFYKSNMYETRLQWDAIKRAAK